MIAADLAISEALAVHLPAFAPDGLHDRIMAVVEATPQQRRLPAFASRLFDADPAARRRSLLVAAALLVALTIAVAAAIGGVLEQRRPRLDIDPPRDLALYVDSAYVGLANLPAFAMVGLESGDERRVNSDGLGAIRDEPPSTGVTRIVRRDGVIELTTGPNGSRTAIRLGRSDIVPGLEIRRYMGLDTRWQGTPAYIGLEYVLDRPAHRIRCGIAQFWIDVETRLVLRSAVVYPSAESPPPGSPAGPSAAPGASWEVIALRVEDQPSELFSLDPPQGYTVVRADDPACGTS